MPEHQLRGKKILLVIFWGNICRPFAKCAASELSGRDTIRQVSHHSESLR